MSAQKKSLQSSALKVTLDRFYSEFNFSERLNHDPVEFPHRYSDPEDIEIAGFIAACFAYGKVGLFKPVIEKILLPGGKHPARFIAQFTLEKDADKFRDISYRFNKEKDVLCLIYMLSQVFKKWRSLKNLFAHYYKPDHEDIRAALEGFVEYFLSMDTSPVYGRNAKPSGLTQLLPSPVKGSACKRMNLFLRWMVRTKDIDLGVWGNIPTSKLIIPLDIHISRIARCIGLTQRSAADWKTAKEITESLKKLAPRDPLKYDFALCHKGISGMCKGDRSAALCAACEIYPGRP